MRGTITPPALDRIENDGTTTEPAVALLAIRSLPVYGVVLAGLTNDDDGLVIAPDERAVAVAGTPPSTPWKGNATVSVVPAGLDCGNDLMSVAPPDGTR